MSVPSEITRLEGAKSKIKSAIERKGVSVATSLKIDAYDTLIDQIETPDATIYTGSGDPSSSLGSNGDIYLKV